MKDQGGLLGEVVVKVVARLQTLCFYCMFDHFFNLIIHTDSSSLSSLSFSISSRAYPIAIWSVDGKEEQEAE